MERGTMLVIMSVIISFHITLWHFISSFCQIWKTEKLSVHLYILF